MANTSNIANIHNGHEFVDLGLPSGLLWATCNVGATSPEQAGLYFAWGETTGYTAAQVKAEKHIFRNSVWSFFKTRKIKGNITLEQDAAHTYMGGMWRIPTKDECQNLIDNCNVTWTTNYNGTGMAGKLFTSKINGKSVFFPAAGFCQYSSVHIQNVTGFYWLSNWNSTKEAWHLYFNFGNVGSNYNYRYFGGSVRGVCHKI